MDFWNAYWTFTAFVFGAIVGSFLNVCIWRLPNNLSLWHPPSHCPSCQHRLKFVPDMIPLFNQLWFRSRCRYCKTPFSWRYFWVEVLTACLFAAVYIRYGIFAPDLFGDLERTVSPFLGCAFVAALIAIFFIDLEHYQIPDLTVIVAFLAAVGKDLFLIWRGFHPLGQSIPGVAYKVPIPLSLLYGLLAFWLLWQFAALATAALGKEAMGAGDSLLMAAMGAFLLPWPLLVVAFLAAVALGTVGGLIGIVVAMQQEKKAAANLPATNAGETTAQTSAAPMPEAVQGPAVPREMPAVLITPELLEDAQRSVAAGNRSLEEVLAQQQVDGFKLLQARAYLHKMRAVDLRRTHPVAGVEAHVSAQLARRLGVVPICVAEKQDSTELVVAVPQPETEGGLAELQAAAGLPVRMVLADPGQIAVAQEQLYGADAPAAPAASPADALTLDEAAPKPPMTEEDVPRLPAASRWGRLITVAGTWVAVGSLWLGLAAGGSNLGMGVGVGVVGLLLASGIIAWGGRMWVKADESWLPAMDEFFDEGEPGPRFIPFGPYLVAGTVIAMFFGTPLVHWYLNSVMLLSPDALGKLILD